MTCLLDAVELFVLVKGVGDVLARRWSWVLTCLLVSRASMTCLLDVEQGVDEVFAVVKGAGDVLAWRGAGCLRVRSCQGRR